MIARAIGVVMILPSFRMSLIGRLTVIASFLLAAQPAAAQLSPTSKWQIDSSGPMCVLHREYGTPKKRFTLELKAVPTTTQMILYVFDDEAGADRVFSPAIVSFGPNSLVAQTRLETYRARRGGYRFNSVLLSREEVDRAEAANRLSISAGGYLNADLSVPDMDAALRAIDDCNEAKVESWGMSRELQRSVVSWPEPDKPWSEYLNQNDYTLLALIMESTGVNSARVRVDRNGNATDCQLLEKSGAQGLDKVLCPAALRPKFKPALDKAGNPVDAFIVIRVHWLLM